MKIEDINQLNCSILPKSYSFGKYSVTDSLSAHDNKIERKGPNNSHVDPIQWHERRVGSEPLNQNGWGIFYMKNGRRKVSRVRFKTRERKKKLRESSVKNTTLEKIKKQFQTKKKV